MAHVTRKEYINSEGVKVTESAEDMIKRFTRQTLNEGLFKELRNREYYKSKGQKRREKKLAAERAAWIRKKKSRT